MLLEELHSRGEMRFIETLLRSCPVAALVESLFIEEREKLLKVKKPFFGKVTYSMKKKAVIWKGERALAAAYATEPDPCRSRVCTGTTRTDYLP